MFLTQTLWIWVRQISYSLITVEESTLELSGLLVQVHTVWDWHLSIARYSKNHCMSWVWGKKCLLAINWLFFIWNSWGDWKSCAVSKSYKKCLLGLAPAEGRKLRLFQRNNNWFSLFYTSRKRCCLAIGKTKIGCMESKTTKGNFVIISLITSINLEHRITNTLIILDIFHKVGLFRYLRSLHLCVCYSVSILAFPCLHPKCVHFCLWKWEELFHPQYPPPVGGRQESKPFQFTLCLSTKFRRDCFNKKKHFLTQKKCKSLP